MTSKNTEPRDRMLEDFTATFNETLSKHAPLGRRIGIELKFPFVKDDGEAVAYETLDALWRHLIDEDGWTPDVDPLSGRVVGARRPGEHNETVASCETGYAKVEFSLAHAADLHELNAEFEGLRACLKPFCEAHAAHLLGYGIHPVSPPGRRLLMKKARAGTWDRVRSTNNHIAPEDGVDMHLFTVNTASHCHVSVAHDEAVPLVNVLNGFSGAQIALTADSSVWRGRVDPEFLCVAEKFWDWWMPEGNRTGVPEKRFAHLRDYVETIGAMRPVFVKREGKPLLLEGIDAFSDFYNAETVTARNLEGAPVEISPEEADLALHNTCYWYNARISGYYTVENRANDQQPPNAQMAVAALTLGLASALPEAIEEIAPWDWSTLREAREAACRDALAGKAGALELRAMAQRMLDLAETGLKRRALGEERFLEPLRKRLETGECPAEGAAETFRQKGVEGLIAEREI